MSSHAIARRSTSPGIDSDPGDRAALVAELEVDEEHTGGEPGRGGDRAGGSRFSAWSNAGELADR